MEFIDHTGHIFTQKSYDDYPVGYEFETLPYIFWIDRQYTQNLSIDNYYMIPIRPLIENDRNGSIVSLSIKCNSKIFKLIASKRIQEQQSLTIELEENSDDFKSELTLDDVLQVKDDEFTMLPFYVIGNSPEEGTFTTTILISVYYKNGIQTHCPITVGGVWVDEIEQLQINASNMGVSLPKDIIKAVYQASLVNDKLDTALYNDKVKEYLINYMSIKGECGNTNSAINSLKWFGYGDKITIDTLIRTDNNLYTQYVHDNLSINNDIIKGFENFVNTSLFTLIVKENEDIENASFAFNEDFYGENNPQTQSLFDRLIESRYDEKDIVFYKPYYEFTLQEMFLKLSCLKYYYQKYFLPMHVGIYSASIQHKEYCNDIKFTVKPFNKICSNLVILNDADVNVKFPEDSTIYFYSQNHYIDELYNEFSDYEDLGNNTDMSIYYVDDICFSIPISITGDEYYRCKLLIKRSDNQLIYESSFNFSQNEKHDLKSLVILPKLINKYADINYWLKYSYTLYICVNDKWFDFPFNLNIPELNISFGTLEYKYESSKARQIQEYNTFDDALKLPNTIYSKFSANDIEAIKNFILNGNSYIDATFNAFMYLPSLIDVENINFAKNVIDYTNKGNLLQFISKYRETPMISNNKKYYNRVHYFTLHDIITGEPIRYTGDVENAQIYDNFFDRNGNQRGIVDSKLFEDKVLDYDFYLMHDSLDPEDYRGVLSDKELRNWIPYWYGVFISKDTIDKAETDLDLEIQKYFSDSKYELRYVKSDNKFLINRMTYKDSGGKNIFSTDDIIVATVNNINLPFVLELGSHWNFKPFSLKMNNEANVDSNTNSAIISIGNNNNSYEIGYYDVNVRYSLDSNTQEQKTKRARILVKN